MTVAVSNCIFRLTAIDSCKLNVIKEKRVSEDETVYYMGPWTENRNEAGHSLTSSITSYQGSSQPFEKAAIVPSRWAKWTNILTQSGRWKKEHKKETQRSVSQTEHETESGSARPSFERSLSGSGVDSLIRSGENLSQRILAHEENWSGQFWYNLAKLRDDTFALKNARFTLPLVDGSPQAGIENDSSEGDSQEVSNILNLKTFVPGPFFFF